MEYNVLAQKSSLLYYIMCSTNATDLLDSFGSDCQCRYVYVVFMLCHNCVFLPFYKQLFMVGGSSGFVKSLVQCTLIVVRFRSGY